MPEDAIETADEAVEATPIPEAVAEEIAQTQVYTAEDIAKARAQEKDKLYGTLNNLKEELSVLRKERDEAAAKEAERKAQRAAREAELQKKKQEEAEAELGFKELLKKKEEELEAKLAAERAERERAFALLEKEREFTELQAFRQQRLEQERENIIPELIDLIQETLGMKLSRASLPSRRSLLEFLTLLHKLRSRLVKKWLEHALPLLPLDPSITTRRKL